MQLKKRKLKKYQEIQEGDKVKFIKLKQPNTLHQDVIAFIGVLPKEFDLHKYIDYDNQFDKSFLEPLRFIVNAIDWSFVGTMIYNMKENAFTHYTRDNTLYNRLLDAASDDKLPILDNKSFELLNKTYGKDKMRTHLADYIATERPVFPLKK